jgi:putative ABC transport system permease protein
MQSRTAGSNSNRGKIRLLFYVLGFLRWRYIKQLDDVQPKIPLAMIKNYLKVSIRNLARHQSYAALNIIGLAVAIASCFLMMIHVHHQLQYDQHIPEKERIFRVALNQHGRYTPARLVKQMRADYPEIATGTRIYGPLSEHIKKGDDFIKMEGGLAADSTFFELFPADFKQGSPEQALKRPNTIVLTESLAAKIFGNDSPIGKKIGQDPAYEVTAVVKDQINPTTIPYQYVAAIPRNFWTTTGYWTGNNFYSYLKLNQGADPKLLESKFPEFVRRYIAPEILEGSDNYASFDEYLNSGRNHSFHLIPLEKIHLHYPSFSLGKPGNIRNLVVFFTIALFVLFIASINYINMATASSAMRAKEIGMRKVLGAVRGGVAGQFFVESFLVAFFAIVMGIGLALLALPYFNMVTGQTYSVSMLFSTQSFVIFLSIWLIVGVLSGSYPAAFLSSFQPIAALRGSVTGSKKHLRRALVVFQFSISIFLIGATMLVYHQVDHMSNRELGINAEQTFILKNGVEVISQMETFQSELVSHHAIEEMALSNHYPSSFIADWNYETGGENGQTYSPFNIFVTPSLQSVWGLKLLKGRFFDDQLASDSSTVIINASFQKALGWKNPIGKTLSRGPGEDFRIIGVIDDFALGSAKRGNYPLVLRYAGPDAMANASGSVSVMVSVTGNYLEAVRHIEKTWKNFVNEKPFEGQFLDASFNRLYDQERRFAYLFTGFSFLAILIAIVGLFALSAFTLERRMKEIAIRKVLGASVHNVVVLIAKEFSIFILISAAIASPLIIFLGNTWLEDYVYRIELSVWHVLIPFTLVMLIAIGTVVFQTMHRATGNPANALTQE